MIDAPGCILEGSGNVFRFQIRKLLEDFFPGKAGSKQVKDIDHPNAHASDAGSPPTLVRTDGNSIK